MDNISSYIPVHYRYGEAYPATSSCIDKSHQLKVTQNNSHINIVRSNSAVKTSMKASSSTSALNSDDDDDLDVKSSSLSYKERRREAHTQAEQKRRDAIKRGYDTLQDLVPTCQQSDVSGCKLSKATVLQRSIDYIQYQQQQKRKQEDERNALKKEVIALTIMKSNIEQIVKAQQAQPTHVEMQVSDEVKFSVFQAIMEELFKTFSAISLSSFENLSAGAFGWIEEYCKPQTLKATVYKVLQSHNDQMRRQQPPPS